MQTFLHLIEPLRHIIAFAGGGGTGGGFSGTGGGFSGGGHGGAGAGSTDGSVQNVLVAVLAGFLPANYASHWCMRFSRRTAGIVGSVFGIGASIALFFVGIGFGFVGLLAAAIGVLAGMTNLSGAFKRRLFRGKRSLMVAASADPVWQEQAIQDRVRDVFYAYQKDWSDGNVQHMAAYLEPQYYQHVRLMMAAMHQMGRRNLVGEPELLGIDAVDVVDSADNDQDKFSVLIAARADDRLIDTATGTTLYSGTAVEREIWWFDRSGDAWSLARIQPTTAETGAAEVALERFAQKHGMFYSLDWGRLLLPQGGRLFGRASFRNSDVNNHVIGRWGDLIVQLYTYVPYNGSRENYLVAQIALPKSYGGIVVKRRSRWPEWPWPPRGYKRVSMEWPDFNKCYTVYATDLDRVTSFELLNPKFMADLYDRQLPFNIEVADNVVYLYAPITGMAVSGSYERYAAALDVLQAAHKELYM